MNQKIKIFLDMDHVIYDWDRSALALVNIDVEDPIVRNIVKTEYSIEKDLNYPRSKFVEVIRSNKADFWANLKLYPWSRDLYNRLNEISNVIFLTSPGDFPHAYEGKISALNRDFNTDRIILTRHKYCCADNISILIDDSIRNIDEFKQHGGHVFRWPNPYYLLDGGKDLYDQYIDQCIDYIKLKMDA